MIHKFISDVISKRIDLHEHIAKLIEKIKKIDKEYEYFTAISEELAFSQVEDIKKKLEKGFKGKLLGIPISVKDCICVKGVESAAGSQILQGYIPPYHATSIQKAIDEGAIIIGKTTQDEFGFGTFSTNTKKIPKNPFDKERSCGGSSGGSCGAIQKIDHVSIAESTGGSIACPASFCGVSGLTPTYGRISRYGLIDYANSLDKIGTVAKTVEDSFYLLQCIAGEDQKDSTSISKPFYENKKIKIGVLKDNKTSETAIEKIFWDRIKKLESEGIPYQEVSTPLNEKYSIEDYYLIALSEASTNLAKYCGMRYGKQEDLQGNFNEYFTKLRTAYFTKETKRRIILGTFARMAGFRNAYYLQAMKVRTLLIQEYKKLFKNVQLLATPTMPILPPKLSEIEKLTPLQHYMMDAITVGPNLAGLPHLSVNAGFSKNLPVGMMFIADHYYEKDLLNIGTTLERVTVKKTI